MGLLNNLFLSIKTSVGRPLSRTDIYSYCDGFIKRAPVPQDWRPIFSHIIFKLEGVPLTVEDYYRDQLLKPSLDKVADCPTLTLQRAACINEILDDMVWRNMRSCLDKAKTEFGRAMIEDKLAKLWPNQSKDERPLFLDYFYIMSMTVQACLSTLGTNVLHIDKKTEIEIEFYRQYGESIMMLDVEIMDVVHSIFSQDEIVAMELASWKDIYVNPLSTKMSQLLQTSRSKIALNTFDVAEFKAQSDRLDEERAALLKTLPGAS